MGTSLLRDDFEEGIGAVLETVAPRYVLEDFTDRQLDTLRQLTDGHVRHALEVLGRFSAVRPSEDKESVELTDLALWAWRRRLGAPAPGDPVYQVKITLAEVADPPVWRRLLVPAAMRLDRLHDAIQAAMGWLDYHLHVFSDGRTEYGVPDPELAFRDERAATVRDLLPRVGSWARYTCDFGDDWEHEIVTEQRLAAEPSLAYPVCMAGAGACPPEDCGGVWGYEHLREVLADPNSEQHQEMLAWLGLDKATDFDPHRFDIDQANRALVAAAARQVRR